MQQNSAYLKCSAERRLSSENSGFRMAETSITLKLFTRQDLDIITDNFNPENLIGRTHFGEVYKGVYRRAEVTVKLWGFIRNRPPIDIPEETLSRNISRVTTEVRFLTDPSIYGQPCIPKLIGQYLDEEKSRMFAVVYDFASSDTLLNVTTNDEFNWTQRIKVVRDLAELLELLHDQEPPYRVCNLDPLNIMLDKGRKPMLIDFSLVTRKDRILEDNVKDLDLIMNGFLDYDPLKGLCFVENDVYSFSLLLLGLISKHVHDHVSIIGTYFNSICQWAVKEYTQRNEIDSSNSLAHESFREEEGFDDVFATRVTKFAIRCLRNDIQWRPSMKLFARLLGNPLAPEYVDGITSDILLDCNSSLEKLSLQDLEASAETFEKENMIGYTQFGALYKGAAKFHGCIVKTWGYFDTACGKIFEQQLECNWYRFKNEIKFLKNRPFESCSFPNLKAYFCDEEKGMFAVVYDLTATDHETLMDLIPRDDFMWTRRIEVALALACVVEKLHCQNYMILDLDWSTIMLNKMWMPILVDFSLITTINRGSEEWLFKFYHRLLDNGLHDSKIVSGSFEMGSDVHSFASILLGLISKRSEVEFPRLEWAAKEYESRSSCCSNMLCSLAEESFERESCYDACSAAIITKMVSACLHPTAGCRPSIKEVVEVLEACHSILEVKLNQKTSTGTSDMPWEASKWCLTRFTEEDLGSIFRKKTSIEGNGYINIYLGRISPDRCLTVKTWGFDSSMMDIQIFFLSLPKVRKSNHFPMLIGYYKSNLHAGVVYNFQAMGTLRSLIKEGKLTWVHRISVALGIAESLGFFHRWKPLHLICKIDPEHILLDQNFKPMLTEFSMVTGGNFCHDMDGTITSSHEESDDVSSFGVILSTLISKNEGPNSDLIPVVHQSLEADPDYDVQLGERMVKLALQCLNTDLEQRPTVTEIINSFPRGIRMV